MKTIQNCRLHNTTPARRRPLCGFLHCAVITALALAAAPAAAPGPLAAPAALPAIQQNADLLLKCLEKSGLKYEKVGDAVWRVVYQGENRQEVIVAIKSYEDLAVIQSVVAENARPTADQMFQLLRLNFERDLAKLSVLKDNSVVALNETELRILDSPALKRIVQAVAVLADDATPILQKAADPAQASSLSLPRERDQLSLLTLLQGKATMRYDPSQWKPQSINAAGVSQLSYLPGDLWVKVITERIEVPVDSLPDIVLSNAKDEDPNAKIVKRGWRMVNGTRLTFLEYELSIKGIQVTFYNHMCSGPFGTIQIAAWTGRSLIDEFRPVIERLVSGFEIPR